MSEKTTPDKTARYEVSVHRMLEECCANSASIERQYGGIAEGMGFFEANEKTRSMFSSRLKYRLFIAGQVLHMSKFIMDLSEQAKMPPPLIEDQFGELQSRTMQKLEDMFGSADAEKVERPLLKFRVSVAWSDAKDHEGMGFSSWSIRAWLGKELIICE